MTSHMPGRNTARLALAAELPVGGTLVLGSEGLAKLAAGDLRARAYLDTARARGAGVAVSVITLTEVL